MSLYELMVEEEVRVMANRQTLLSQKRWEVVENHDRLRIAGTWQIEEVYGDLACQEICRKSCIAC